MKLALGTAQFGQAYGVANKCGQVDLAEVRSILDAAKQHGFDTLDTAIAYGDSEQRLGKLGVQDWKVISKLPGLSDDCQDIGEWVRQSVGQSLERLQTDRLYGLLLHRPMQLLESYGGELYEAMDSLKKEGRVMKIGLSIYSPHELDAICPNFAVDLIQGPFNLLDRRMLDTGWLTRLAEGGVEFHARSLFLQGLLVMDAADRPPKFQRWEALWRVWHDWLNTTGLSPLQACLRYVIGFPEVKHAVIGVDSHVQLEEIVVAAQGVCPSLPCGLATDDLNLINPGAWALIDEQNGQGSGTLL